MRKLAILFVVLLCCLCLSIPAAKSATLCTPAAEASLYAATPECADGCYSGRLSHSACAYEALEAGEMVLCFDWNSGGAEGVCFPGGYEE